MDKVLKILIVEDVKTDEELIRIELSNSSIQFESIRVEGKEKYIETLHSFCPDAIMSDYSLPQFSGLEALRIRNEFNKEIPFILVTGAQTEEIAVKCIREGADDYILKSSLTRLPTALLNAVEKKKAEKETRQAVERTLFIIESIPHKLWTAKADGTFDYFNKLWLDYTGKNLEEMKSAGWNIVLHEEDKAPNERVWNHAIKTGTNFQIEHRLRNKADDYRWHLTKGSVQKDEKGKILMWIGTSTDIQDIKVYQQSLANSKEQLQVINEELQSKNEQLTKTNNDLDNFVYAASHDLKAPVSNIEGLISTLEDAVSTSPVNKEEVGTILGLIKTSITHFRNTILDLTEISKVQKKSTEDISKISFHEAIEDAIFPIDNEIKENVSIHIDVEAYPVITFSRKDLKSILYNLLSNAMKYRSPDRSPEIHVRAEKTGDYVLLSVKDNGLGIPPSGMPKLFEMFKRFHSHVEGTGVGLYLVKRIVDNTGGRIDVQSEVNKGTEFNIFLKEQKNISK